MLPVDAKTEIPDDTLVPDTLARTLLSGPGSLPPAVDPGGEAIEESGFSARYQLRQLLGEGGMGQVLLCKDTRIGREVALKKIHAHVGSRSDVRQRFVREARVQGQLEHPSIVPVYDLGLDPEGAAYFAMKRVRGLTLGEIIDGLRAGNPEFSQRYSRRKLLTAFATVCLALDFAHQRGVLHRDLKPGNIMLGDFGEVYLLDWGLARVAGTDDVPGDAEPMAGSERIELAEADRGKTAAGALMGTPGYMSPEQVRTDEIDARADVYALGAILFELLALEPLHDGRSTQELMMAALFPARARLSERVPAREMPPELEAICVKATALDPADRFQSARALCDAVERFLDGDRDLALRREMAEKHAAAAEEEARRAVGEEAGANEESARRSAMNEVSRALALDPRNATAMKTLVDLMMHPPKQVPAEAKAEMAKSTQMQNTTAARTGVLAYLSCLLYFPLLLWVGVRDYSTMLASLGLFIAAAVIAYVGARRPSDTFWIPLSLLGVSTLAIAFLSRFAGPFIVVPAMAVVNTLAFAITPHRRRRFVFIGVGTLAVILPLLVEALGWITPAYEFRDGAMLVLSHMTEMPAGRMTLYLTISAVGAVVIGCLVIGRVRDALSDAEERMQIQAWHLRHLVPQKALDGVDSRPAADAGGVCSFDAN